MQGRGSRADKKFILGTLSWQFSVMSQFDRMDKGEGRAFNLQNTRDETIRRGFCSTAIIQFLSRTMQLLISVYVLCFLRDAAVLRSETVPEKICYHKWRRGGVRLLRCSRLVRKRRIAFPSAQMESDIWRRDKIQLEAGVFSVCVSAGKNNTCSTKDVCVSDCCVQAGSVMLLLLLLLDVFSWRSFTWCVFGTNLWGLGCRGA